MADVIQACLRVIRASGRSPARIYTGLAFRAIERAFAIAPYFLAWFYISQLSPFEPGVDNRQTWLFATFWLIALLLGQMLFSYLGQMNCFLGSYALTVGYRARLIDRLRQLPLGMFERQRIGHLLSVVTDDVKSMESVFTHLIAELFAALSVPLLFSVVLIWVDWRLTVALLVLWPLSLLILNGMNRFFLTQVNRGQALRLEVNGLIVEFVGGLRTLKLFNRTPVWIEKLDRLFARIRTQSMGAEALGGASVQAYRLVLEMSLPILLAVTGWLALQTQIAPIVWLLFALVAYKILEPSIDVGAYLVELRTLVQGEARLQKILDEPPLKEGERTEPPSHFSLAYRQVSFAYGTKEILHNIDFKVPERSVTALVGPSGSGKSSLLQLLARFYDPQQGSITIGDIDVRLWRSDALYQQISFVFQDVQLFDGSILENVRIGRQGASDAEVIDACKAACCDSFVQLLPQKYDTPIGENGQQLSGGERQRVSIARAFLKNAPILLLDEATAAVDPQTQSDIQKAMSRLILGRTVIMIAHRLQTIRQAGQILVLDQGRIREQGTHETLLAQNGLYAELWQEQDIVTLSERDAR